MLFRSPAAVLSFTDVPFPVCSSFWHGISPFRQRTIPHPREKSYPNTELLSESYHLLCIAPFFAYCGANFALPGRSLWLVQNKHSARSANEGSEAMLIFVIMRGQWMDGFFGEPSARAVNSPPPSYYKNSIEQVAPAITKRKQPKICIT